MIQETPACSLPGRERAGSWMPSTNAVQDVLTSRCAPNAVQHHHRLLHSNSIGWHVSRVHVSKLHVAHDRGEFQWGTTVDSDLTLTLTSDTHAHNKHTHKLNMTSCYTVSK